MLLAPGVDSAFGSSDSAVRRMRVRVAAEAASNARKEQAWLGQPVMCGHIIQLRHLRSGRFISLAERALAPLDPSCSLVELTEAGSTHCWLQLEPGNREQARCTLHCMLVGRHVTRTASRALLAVILYLRLQRPYPDRSPDSAALKKGKTQQSCE